MTQGDQIGIGGLLRSNLERRLSNDTIRALELGQFINVYNKLVGPRGFYRVMEEKPLTIQSDPAELVSTINRLKRSLRRSVGSTAAIVGITKDPMKGVLNVGSRQYI
jgi:DNA integrity scanning protein DisA with diadenylate cyclase activity